MKILSSVFSMLKAGGQVLVIRLLAIFLQFGFVWFITQQLGDTTYGEFVIYLMVTQFIGTVCHLGMETLLVKNVGSIYPVDNRYNTAFLRQVSIISLVMSIVLTVTIVTVTVWFNPGYLPDLPLWTYVAGSSVYGFMRLFVEFYRAIRWITLSAILSYVVAPVIAISILWFIKVPAGDLYSLVLAWLAAISFIVTLSLLTKWFAGWDENIKTKGRVPSRRQLLIVASPFLISTLLVFVNEWVDKIVLNHYVESDILGHYYVAFKLSAMVSLPLMAFNTLLAPKISHAYEEQKPPAEIRKTIIDVLRWAFWLAVIAFACFVVLGKWLLGIFGEQFVAMYPILLILSVGQLVNVAAGPVGVTMKMTNLKTLYAKIMGSSVLINVVLSFMLVPYFGVYGAAVSSAIGLILVNCGAWYYCRKMLGVSTGMV